MAAVPASLPWGAAGPPAATSSFDGGLSGVQNESTGQAGRRLSTKACEYHWSGGVLWITLAALVS